MSTGTGLAKCSCSFCDGHLEFESAYAGERIACPHCANETVLYIPGQTPPLPPPLPAALQTAPIADSPYTSGNQSASPAPFKSSAVSVSQPAPPRETGSFAPLAARLSWVLFLVALSVCFLFEKTTANVGPFLLNATLLLMLAGVVLGVVALFGLRTYRLRGILIPALIGILLNGGVLWALHRVRAKHFTQVSRKTAASVSDVLRQATNYGRVTNIRSTGNARVDATIRLTADIINQGYALRDSINSETKALGERPILSALGSKAEIKFEMDKRAAAQQIIQRHHQENSALLESIRQKLRAVHLPKEIERRELAALDTRGPLCSRMDAFFSLKLRFKQAESELLQFLWSEFGSYRVVNERVLFRSELKLQEFNRLVDKSNKVVREGRELERQLRSQ